MFSDYVLEYRAGVEIEIGTKKYAYSLKFFMRCFVEYIQKKTKNANTLNRMISNNISLNSIRDIFCASQSLTEGSKTISDIDFSDENAFFHFLINGRNILCAHDSNCYVYDNNLIAQYSEAFQNTNGISYLEMARFLKRRIDLGVYDDVIIADKMIKIIRGEKVDDHHAEVLSIMIATIFIAEPKRNPSCFIPSLLLLDLIKNQQKTSFGDIYTWDNCLQNIQLVNQGQPPSLSRDYIYPHMVGIPSRPELKTNNKIPVEEDQNEFLNTKKEYNKTKNQKEIQSSEFLMQLGGWFPNSHRFSYAELEHKRANDMETLSDIKSFAIIVDWLTFKKVAKPIHMVYLSRYPDIDTDKAILTEVIFSTLYEKIDELLTGVEVKFNRPPPLKKGYPALLTQFGVPQRKATPEKIANVIYLIHDSSNEKYESETIKQLKLQFTFWSINNNFEFGIEEVEKSIESTYKLN